MLNIEERINNLQVGEQLVYFSGNLAMARMGNPILDSLASNLLMRSNTVLYDAKSSTARGLGEFYLFQVDSRDEKGHIVPERKDYIVRRRNLKPTIHPGKDIIKKSDKKTKSFIEYF